MDHVTYMRHCLDLAARGRGYTVPNPMVGAVLVYDDRIIGEGWHRKYGEAHAEVNCIEQVLPGDRHLIPASTMYVSLEPCAHYGNTPPCALRLVKEKVKEVIIANTDPFEKVSGRGLEILRAAGIHTQTGILENEGRWLNRRFFCFHEQKRPYIILKWAESSDGFIAPADRSRLQITGPESQRLVHQWRTEEAAIMVGATTALNDNPQLTARLHPGKQPLRIALDRNLQIPLSHNLYNTDARTWIVNEQRETDLNDQVSYVKLPFDTEMLPHLLNRLYTARILSLIVEGGAALLSSFITAGLWDEARVFSAPVALESGISAPQLSDKAAAFTSHTGNDTLHIFTNKNSKYHYVTGMEL